LSFALAEIGVRLLGSYDQTGQFYFMGRPVPPFAIPIEDTKNSLIEYEKNFDKAMFVFDALLGWSPHPNYSNTETGVYINSAGIRSNREFDLLPAKDTLRIALFGDSYTFDADVSNQDMWSLILEESLLEKDINAEVINFGVSAFGMDQAYLRWQLLGESYQPDIVIFGFVLKNTQRNVNIFREFANATTDIPFSKPRFVFKNNDLHLLNSPTIPIDEILDTLSNFHHNELSRYEYFYDSRYTQKWWLASKFLSLIVDVLNTVFLDTTFKNDINNRPNQVILARTIVEHFREDVINSKSEFIVTFLPDKTYYHRGNHPKYENILTLELLSEFEDQYNYFNIENAFTDHGGFSFPPNIPESHYTPEMNAIIGEYLADQIIGCIDSGKCQLNRFEEEHTFDKR